MPIPLADATGSATLVITGITLALVIATFVFVLGNRASTEQARDDLMAQLERLRSRVERVEQQSVLEPEPSDHVAAEGESAAPAPKDTGHGTDSSTREDSGRQPVTDIWGNPLDKRGRRRR
jgi:hypothetical protein